MDGGDNGRYNRGFPWVSFSLYLSFSISLWLYSSFPTLLSSTLSHPHSLLSPPLPPIPSLLPTHPLSLPPQPPLPLSLPLTAPAIPLFAIMSQLHRVGGTGRKSGESDDLTPSVAFFPLSLRVGI